MSERTVVSRESAANGDAKVSVPEGAVEAALKAFYGSISFTRKDYDKPIELAVAAAAPFILAAIQKAPANGWRLVPEKMHMSADSLQGLAFTCGFDLEQNGDTPWLDGTLWVGEITDVDDGKKTYGLHVLCDECPEEGSATLVEFDPPPYILAGASQDATGANAPPVADGVRVPDGWRLVPIEPTYEMLLANGECDFPSGREWLNSDAKETWAAMLSASPQPPAIATHGADERDAARYRWLRDLPLGSHYESIGNFPGDMWDKAIDDAMKEESH